MTCYYSNELFHMIQTLLEDWSSVFDFIMNKSSFENLSLGYRKECE